jgi:hypothetical protein
MSECGLCGESDLDSFLNLVRLPNGWSVVRCVDCLPPDCEVLL